MSPTSMAGLIRGISIHLWIYETSPKLAAVSVFHLVSMVTNGTVSLPTRYVLATVPSVVRVRVSVLWPRMVSGRYPGVVFSKLSKLLNQEDALSAPWLRDDFCSRRRALAGRRNAAERRKPSLLKSHYLWDHRVIMLTSADGMAVVGGRCTGRARRCKAKQGRRGKTALTWEYLIPQ